MTTFVPVPNEGVAYVRAEMPARALGADVLWLPEWLVPGQDPLEGVSGVTVWQIPGNVIRLELMQSAAARGCQVIFEADDDYTEWQPAYARGNWTPDWPESRDTSSPAVIRAAAEFADAVIVSTEHLAERYGRYNPRVFVCPNAVDPADWPERPARDGVFRVGFAGSYNPQDGALVRRALEWAAREEAAEAWFLGADPRFRGVRSLRWVASLENYRRSLVNVRLDVGLRPLELTTFSRSKSDLKILEYAMAGALPLVSAAPAYAGWRDSPVLYAASAKDFERQVKRASRRLLEVREQAEELRELVLATRSIEQTADAWRAAIGAVAVALA